MSQIYKRLTATSPIPGNIPTIFQSQDGTAFPSANILIINGNDSIENNNNGIISKGGVVGTGTSNEVDIILTNRVQGTGTTVGAATADIITFTPTVIGTYSIEYRTAAYNVTSSIGGGYSFFGAVRFDGVNSTVCDLFDEIVNEEGAMSAVDLAVVVSGANFILRSTGYAGQTINWSSVGLYTFIGV